MIPKCEQTTVRLTRHQLLALTLLVEWRDDVGLSDVVARDAASTVPALYRALERVCRPRNVSGARVVSRGSVIPPRKHTAPKAAARALNQHRSKR